MPKVKAVQITDIEIAKAIIAHEAVDCFSATEQKVSAQSEKLVSCTGGTFWGKPDEKWPCSSDGQPLIPWVQIVCTEMDRLYGAFYKRKAVCFYIRQDFDGFEATSVPDGGDFVVREYRVEDKLVPLSRPQGLERHPFHHVKWRRVSDFPSIGKYDGLFSDQVIDALSKIKNFKYVNRSGIKIGGWPTPVQRAQEYPNTHDLQVDMTENYMYGDSGIGYVSHRSDRWHVIFESC